MTGIVVSGETGRPKQKQLTEQDLARAFAPVVGALETAWNSGNAKAYAAVFGPQADYIDMLGGHGAGRAQIEKAQTAMFAKGFANSKVSYGILKVKPLGGGTVVLFLRQKLTLAAGGKDSEILSRPTITMVRNGKTWQIAVFQNTRVTTAAAATKAAPAKAAPAKAAPAKAEAAKASAKPAAKKKG